MLRKLALVPIASIFATAAAAHPGHGPHGVLEGPLHSLNGLEQIAAATVVGVIAVIAWRLRARRQMRRAESRDRSTR